MKKSKSIKVLAKEAVKLAKSKESKKLKKLFTDLRKENKEKYIEVAFIAHSALFPIVHPELDVLKIARQNATAFYKIFLKLVHSNYTVN